MNDTCLFFDVLQYEHTEEANVTSFDPTLNSSYPSDNNIDTDSQGMRVQSVLEVSKFYLTEVIDPMFCICGIIGNLCNILVLSQQKMKKSMDSTMGQAVQICLIAMAVSDLMYCLTGLLRAFGVETQVLYMSKDFWLYVRLYGNYVQNIFMYTSTWLTVIMAAGRYVAICRPLHARSLVGFTVTRIAVICTFVFWVFFQLPTLWNYSVVEVKCRGRTKYILDQGEFSTNLKLRMTFSYLWTIIGYLIPVIILVFCNVHLIKALHKSKQMHNTYRANVSPKSEESRSYITPTLVAIVCMFLLLHSPSEIMQFLYYTVSPHNVESFNFALVFSNVLLTANLAFNFVMYCIVNVKFRETLHEVFFYIIRRKIYSPIRSRAASNASTNSIVSSQREHSLVQAYV